MTIDRSIGVLSLLAACTLAACGGGVPSAAHALPATSGTPSAGTPNSAATFAWGSGLLRASTYAGRANDVPMTAHVALKLADAQGLASYAQQASDPHSAMYRHFLTPTDIASRYGASASNQATVVSYFQRAGLSVGTWPQRLEVVVTGKRSQFETAFGTTIGWYRNGMQTFLAPVGTPRLPPGLPVTAVPDLVGAQLTQSDLVRYNPANFQGYSPAQIAHAFDYSGAFSSGYNGTGIQLGIIGTGPITQGSSGDLALYHKVFPRDSIAALTQMPVVAQAASAKNGNTGTGSFDDYPSGLATPPPTTHTTCTAGNPLVCNPEDGEAQLDTEQAASLAPGAGIDFYLAYNRTTNREGIQIADDEVQQAIADNVVDVLSLSYGQDELSAQTAGYFQADGTGPGPAEFAALAAEGIAVFVSSGDNGEDVCQNPFTGAHEPGYCVSYPASDPSVVAVGGVNAPLDNAGNIVGDVTAWGDQTSGGGDGSYSNNIGSGGGVSQWFATPAFQQGLTVPAGDKHVGMRAVPDIALIGDIRTGPALLQYSGSSVTVNSVGGTSIAAPQAAAMWADVLSACKKSSACDVATQTYPDKNGVVHHWRLGNPNPSLYTIYKSSLNAFTYGTVFYDVVYGVNYANAGPSPEPELQSGCCAAGKGYDEVTGLGVPFAGHLIDAFVKGLPAQVP
jgi:subtilase family serine protease